MPTDRTVAAVQSNAPVLASQIDHNALTNLAVGDVHTHYALLAGRSGGQELEGGTGAADVLTLTGSSHVDAGIVRVDSPMEIGDTFLGGIAVQRIGYDESFTSSGGLIVDAGILFQPTVAVTSTSYSWTGVGMLGTVNQDAAPNATFTGWSGFSAQATMRTTGTHATSPSIAFTASIIHENDGAGGAIADTTDTIGLAFRPQLRASVSADRMGVGETVAVLCDPTFNTIGGTTIDFGTIMGLKGMTPRVTLFGTQTGTEQVTDYWLVHMDNVTGNPIPSGNRAVIHSDLSDTDSGNRFLFAEGNAASVLFGSFLFVAGAQIKMTQDAAGITFGLSADIELYWDAGNSWVWDPVVGDSVEWDFATTDIVRFGPVVAAGAGLRLDFPALSIGTTPPNPATADFAVAITPAARTLTDPVWADFVITSNTANIDIDNQAVTFLDSVRITSPSNVTLGSGSVDDHSALHTVGLGGDGTRNHGLWVQSGRARFTGLMNFDPSSPTQLTADQNNYVIPSSTGGRAVLRMSTDASRTITGIVIEQDGDALTIINVGAFDLILADQNASSTDVNRIITPTGADVTLNPDESAYLWYDPDTNRWRMLSTTGA